MIRLARCLTVAVLGGGLALGSALAAAAPASGAERATGTGVDLTLTVDSGDGPLSLLDSDHPVTAHVDRGIGMVTITVTADPAMDTFAEYRGTLLAPDAPYGGFEMDCAGHSVVVIDVFRCVFVVPIQTGLNRIDFMIGAVGIDPTIIHGAITGAVFGADLEWQVLQADGSWERHSNDTTASVPGPATSAFRYTVRNTGSLPFVVEGSCSEAQVLPETALVCEVRGPMPGYAIAGSYVIPLRITDASRIPVEISVLGRLTAQPSPTDASAIGPSTGLRTFGLWPVGLAAVGLALMATPLALFLRGRLGPLGPR